MREFVLSTSLLFRNSHLQAGYSRIWEIETSVGMDGGESFTPLGSSAKGVLSTLKSGGSQNGPLDSLVGDLEPKLLPSPVVKLGERETRKDRR
jgi:hypothetical protein